MNRKALFTAIALGVTLSAPLAFAQDPGAAPEAQDPAATASPTDQADPAAQATDPSAMQSTDPAAAPTGDTQQITWADLDVDQDGKLTKDEASSVASLVEVFDDADADKDGSLTPDEYKAFVAQNQSDAAAQPQDEG